MQICARHPRATCQFIDFPVSLISIFVVFILGDKENYFDIFGEYFRLIGDTIIE